MKILFAVNNEKIFETIVKQYQKEFKEIVSYKNVYYFNAIIKELQNDSSYDRIVISEDLEPFANNNLETIDRFLIDKLEKISVILEETNIPIILVCSDRREKSENILYKLLDLKIYNAIIKEDRNIDTICELLNNPRDKSKANAYYGLTSENDNTLNQDGVSEEELKNIITHFKKISKEEEKQIASFNNITTQYTDIQLKIIIRYLPLEVKANLEEKCEEYKRLASEISDNSSIRNKKKKSVKKQENVSESTINSNEIKKQNNINILEKKFKSPNLTKPILIPSEINPQGVKKVLKEQENIKDDDIIMEQIESDDFKEKTVTNQEKRGRGRPKKEVNADEKDIKSQKGRGRPRKLPINEENAKSNDVDLFNIVSAEDEQENFSDKNENNNNSLEDINLFDMDNEEINEDNSVEEINLFDMDDEKINEDNSVNDINLFNATSGFMEDDKISVESSTVNELENTFIEKENSTINTLLTKDKKIVSFVGTTKNGTSFIVNNLAQVFSIMGINTAILDMTQNRNSYYIYTNNDEKLRRIAIESINNLIIENISGIEVNKNLTVFTSLPGENKDFSQVQKILNTLIKNYSLVLIDCDFETDVKYFENSQEIYLVQTMDILTIQPLTMFLRNLKNKNVLDENKIKVVINKAQKVKGLSDNVLIGGMAYYNDPAMSFMTELFDKNKVKYCSIPFETQNYIKYLEALVVCSLNLNGYTKTFISALKQLGNMVYPLLNKTTYNQYNKKNKTNKTNFSSSVNNTLNQMKSKY